MSDTAILQPYDSNSTVATKIEFAPHIPKGHGHHRYRDWKMSQKKRRINQRRTGGAA